jgi:hypothetical protein
MEDFATAVWPEQPVASPTRGRGAARPRARTTADAPTEITGAPTTPLPAGRRAKTPSAPAARQRKSRTGVVIGLVVVGAAGAGGYLWLGGRAPESKPAAPSPTPAVDTVRIRDTVRVPAQPVATPARAPARRAERAKPQATPPPAAAPQGHLTIDAEPFGEVYIDNVDVGQTPVIEYEVKPGSHAVRIERPGFKTVNVSVAVDANNTVRRKVTLFPE